MNTIQCPKCDNDTRTSSLMTAMGAVMVAGTIATDPQPVIAQVCTACGYIELYAPQPVSRPEHAAALCAAPLLEPLEAPVPTA